MPRKKGSAAPPRPANLVNVCVNGTSVVADLDKDIKTLSEKLGSSLTLEEWDFVFEDKPLEVDIPLLIYAIQESSNIQVVKRDPDAVVRPKGPGIHYVKCPQRGLVRVLAGEAVKIFINGTVMTADLDNDIQVLANALNTEPILNDWEFSFNGKVLQIGVRLREYGIKEGSNVRLHRRNVLLANNASRERLKKKLNERKVPVRCIEDDEEEASPSSPPSSSQTYKIVQKETEEATDMCAVCLTTTAESGREIHWIFEACGHKCICKPCLRKLKLKNGSTKNGAVECPICRVCSKTMLVEKYTGEVFSTTADV